MSSSTAMSIFGSAKDYIVRFLTADSSRSVLPFVPRPLRFIFLLVLLLNVRSLPLVWHLRVFRPALLARLKAITFFSLTKKEEWLDSLCPVGESPFSLICTYDTWASPDESDYNIHLSNSSYAKLADMTRLKFALAHFSTVFRDDCWIALGATHLRFIREIPLGAKYQIRMYVGSWDSKWLYIVARYVTKKSKSSKKRTDKLLDAKTALKDSVAPGSGSSTSIPIPSVHTPGADALLTDPSRSGSVTPSTSLGGANTDSSKPEHPPLMGLKSLFEEGEGETLHCIAVNECVFKHGRMTVPPELIFAAAGCGSSPEQWDKVNSLRTERQNKNKGEKGFEEWSMRDLMSGKWREIPEGGRWWQDAMGQFENERLKRLSVLKGLREGMETARYL